MNRRLPRIALFVVLLVTMFGVFRGGTPTPPGIALAQDSVECGSWKPFDLATPTADGAFEVTRTYEISEQSNSNLDAPKSLTEITLFENGQLSVVSEESTIIAIDSGLVNLTVCGDDTQVGIQLPGEDTPKQVGPGDYELPAESAVFVDPDDPYFLTGLSSGEATPVAGVQQLDLELSSNALPGAQPSAGSKIKVVTGISRKLCGGTGC